MEFEFIRINLSFGNLWIGFFGGFCGIGFLVVGSFYLFFYLIYWLKLIVFKLGNLFCNLLLMWCKLSEVLFVVEILFFMFVMSWGWCCWIEIYLVMDWVCWRRVCFFCFMIFRYGLNLWWESGLKGFINVRFWRVYYMYFYRDFIDFCG